MGLFSSSKSKSKTKQKTKINQYDQNVAADNGAVSLAGREVRYNYRGLNDVALEQSLDFATLAYENSINNFGSVLGLAEKSLDTAGSLDEIQSAYEGAYKSFTPLGYIVIGGLVLISAFSFLSKRKRG